MSIKNSHKTIKKKRLQNQTFKKISKEFNRLRFALMHEKNSKNNSAT